MFSKQIGPDAELRLLEERHTETLFALTDANRAHLRRWLPWVDALRTAEDTRAFIRRVLAQFAAGDGFTAGIWHGGRLAGVAGFHDHSHANRAASIGYWLGTAFEGHGLVTRATAALVDHALLDLGFNRVEIRCATENRRSQAVPERLGFTYEGTSRESEWLYDHFVDHRVYSVLRREWLARGAPPTVRTDRPGSG